MLRFSIEINNYLLIVQHTDVKINWVSVQNRMWEICRIL